MLKEAVGPDLPFEPFGWSYYYCWPYGIRSVTRVACGQTGQVVLAH